MFPGSFLNRGLRERRHHHLSKRASELERTWDYIINPAFCFIDESNRLGKLKGCACVYTDEGCQELFLNKRSLVCSGLNCSVMSDSFATLWTVAHQAPLSMGILHARILEWVAMPFSRGSSQPGDQTQVSRSAGGFFTI